MAELTELLNYGIDLKARRIYFGVPIDSDAEAGGDFTQVSVEIAVRAMHKMASDAPGKPIEIHMNSYGGDLYSMFSLHDEILSCPCQIKFFGSGAIMSAATFIMVACDERNLHPNATVMVHELSSGDYGKHTDLQIDAAENRRVTDIMCDIYEKNSRMPKDFWLDISQRDVYLSAGEAVSLGMADKVVEPKKRGNLRKTRQAQLKKTPDKDEMNKLITDIYSRTNKLRVPAIHLNPVVKEPVDPHLVVDDKPVEVEKGPQPITATDPTKENS